MTAPFEWAEIAGPVTGATIALIGVFSGLLVNGRRADEESRIRREDNLRTEQRRILATLLTSARTYQRLGEALSDSSAWVDSGYERATALADGTERAMADFQQALITARLLVNEAPLVSDLDRVLTANHETAEVIHEVVNSFWEQRTPSRVIVEGQSRWTEFEEAMAQLHAHAISALRPTIREARSSPARRAMARFTLGGSRPRE